MAAQVSSLVQCLNNNNNGYAHEEDKPSTLITRDLLGIGSTFNITCNSNQELDLDLEVPKGWEKRLDLKSGKVYLQRCTSPPKRTTTTSTTSSSSGRISNSNSLTSQDLNIPPKSNTLNLNLFHDYDDDAFLDLKLRSTSSSISGINNNSNSNSNYQSVCTLDKVKSALERAEREPILPMKKRSPVWKSSSSSPSSSSSSSSTSLSSLREEEATATATNNKTSRCLSESQVAAGCPSCLLYVLISRSDPKCPRCNAHVPLCAVKKPRIDLNISI